MKQNQSLQKKVVFDTETTGFSVNAGDRLIEIGAVELDDKRYSLVIDGDV